MQLTYIYFFLYFSSNQTLVVLFVHNHIQHSEQKWCATEHKNPVFSTYTVFMVMLSGAQELMLLLFCLFICFAYYISEDGLYFFFWPYYINQKVMWTNSGSNIKIFKYLVFKFHAIMKALYKIITKLEGKNENPQDKSGETIDLNSVYYCIFPVIWGIVHYQKISFVYHIYCFHRHSTDWQWPLFLIFVFLRHHVIVAFDISLWVISYM